MRFWERHLTRRVAEYCDDRLSAVDMRRATAHLATCAACRASVDDFRFTAGLVRQLAVVPAPESVWASLERALDASPPRERPASSLRFGFAAAAAIVVLAAGSYWLTTRPAAGWALVHLDGSRERGRLGLGEWLETDATSRVRLTVGDIGEVDVDPGTRVRLVAARDAENRLALARGRISARITAPPRLFFVDTPASTVVDLGCAYTMEADESGLGMLRVTSGWASLEWEGRESIVPAGASCATRPRVGPGTPSFDDAPREMREALDTFDFDNGGDRAVEIVIAQARARDTLTLWHVLSRVEGTMRARIFDRMVELTPLPSGVMRERALQLDPATLQRWREELAWTW